MNIFTGQGRRMLAATACAFALAGAGAASSARAATVSPAAGHSQAAVAVPAARDAAQDGEAARIPQFWLLFKNGPIAGASYACSIGNMALSVPASSVHHEFEGVNPCNMEVWLYQFQPNGIAVTRTLCIRRYSNATIKSWFNAVIMRSNSTYCPNG